MFGLNKPKVLEEVKSKYSGTLRVVAGYGTRYVTTGIWTQSGGVINDVWQPILRKIGKKNKSWLVLGLATGTVAKMISNKYRPARIVGVEIDSEMIRLGKKYFGLDTVSKLEILNLDAQKYIPDQTFDYVLVDMYQTDQLPKFVYTRKFLEKKLGRVVVFNHLFHEDWMKNKAEGLIDKLRLIYEDIKLIRVLTNVMIICQ